MKTKLFTTLFILFSSIAFASTIYVDADATGSNTGTSWANAYTDLQSALSAAISGDEIWVAEGTYKPTSTTTRTISFEIPSGVKVYGGFAGTETELSQRDYENNTTTLSGDIGTGGVDTDNSYHVVKFTNAAITTILDGFTITKGYARVTGDDTDIPNNCGGGIYNDGSGSGNSSNPQITNCIITYNYAYYQGGGVHNEANVGETAGTAGESSPAFTNCDITFNTTTLDGAGVNNEGEDGSVSSPTFTDCTISNNTATDDGGGVCNDGSFGTASPVFINCIINDNNASGYGGGLYNDGDEGISSPAFTNCTINGNNSASGGGAMFNSGYGGTASPTVTNCIFNGNSTDADGGAIYNYGRIYNGSGEASPVINGCTFTGNTAAYSDLGGGAIFNIAWGAGSIVSPIIKNTTFKGNSSTFCGGAIVHYGYDGYLNPKITNCLFFDNTASYGGGIYDYDDGDQNIETEITNCTFNNNDSYAYGAENSDVNTTITNCIFWGDIDGEIQEFLSPTVTITYSDVEGGYTGTGNINSDPGFIDAANDDYRLTNASPCADVGDNTANNETYDIRGTGFGRKLDKTTGAAGTIDMGAYEYKLCSDDYTYSGGSGTSDDPYQIANTQDLIDLSSATCHWGANFIQTAHIDFGSPVSANHTPIGNSTTHFTGVYDGGGFRVRALWVDQTADYAGMFGYVNGGEIKDLDLTVLRVTGGDNYVGGLIGYATGATITNINISTSGTGITGKYELGGMIGEANNCTITNADANATVTSSGGTNAGSNIGGLIGLLSTTGSGSISESTSAGTVTSDGGEDVGGLIGESQVNVSNCSSSADVTAVDFVGGLIGFADGGTIQDSYFDGSTGTVTGNDYVGGLIGDAAGCTISGCYAGGDIDVIGDTDDYIGGLIGRADNCTITGSFFAIGTVTGDDWTGGFIGYALNECNISTSFCVMTTVTGYHNTGGFIGENDWGTVYDCYSAATVNAQGDNVGGFIGRNDDSGGTPSVTECYSTGNVTGTDTDSDDTGGFIGENWGLVENCYSTGDVSNSGGSGGWFAAFIGNNKDEGTVRYCYTTGDYTTVTGGDKGFIHPSSEDAGGTGNFYESSQTSGAGATKKTSSQMKTATNYLDASWDFTKTGAAWAMNQDENSGYPFLRFMENDLFASLAPGQIWLGAAKSTSWVEPNNWSEEELPGTTSNVIVPNVANWVEIGDNVGADCNKLTVETDALLRIQPGGTLITLDVITNNGSIEIKQDVPDTEGWHFISMPNNVTTANTFFDMYLQEWIEGDGPGTGWQDIVDPATLLNPVQGYSLWVNGGTKLPFTYTGTPNTGNQSIAITNTGAGTYQGMNFVGNPYPSYIDWDLVTGYGTKYTWNGTAYEQRTEAGTGSGAQLASPMEGFFIFKDDPVKDNFDLTNAMRTHAPVTKPEPKKLQNMLVMAASNGSYDDELWVVFDGEASEGFELAKDAWKILSGTVGLSQLWSFSTDGKMAVDARPETETIQLGFSNNQTGIYTIGIKEIADITEVYLEDTKTQKVHNLMVGDYEFTWNPEFDSETRFVLHFKAVGIEENTGTDDIPVYAANGNLYVAGQADALTVTDIAGRVLIQQQLPANDRITIPVNLQTGLYMVTLRYEDKIQTTKVFIQ